MTVVERDGTPPSRVLRLRGLPFSATEEQVRQFFDPRPDGGSGDDCEPERPALVPQSIFICRRDGRPTGEAYCALASPEQAAWALAALNKRYMGSRYIELFEAAEADLDAVQRALEADRQQGCVVRLRGLPYSASAEDVARFFEGVALSAEPDAVVFVLSPSDGRRTGEAFVQLASQADLGTAMNRHKECMGHRYIEVFHSSRLERLQELQQQQQQQQAASAQQLRYQRPLAQPHRWQAAAAGGGLHLQHSGAAWHLQAAGMTRQRVVSGVAAPQQQLAAVSSSMVSIIPPSSMPGGMLQQSTAASSAVAASLPAGAIDIGMGSPSSGMLGMPPMSAPVYASPYHMMGPGGGVQYMPLQGMWPPGGPAGMMMQDGSIAGMPLSVEAQPAWPAGVAHPGAPAGVPPHMMHLPRPAWS